MWEAEGSAAHSAGPRKAGPLGRGPSRPPAPGSQPEPRQRQSLCTKAAERVAVQGWTTRKMAELALIGCGTYPTWVWERTVIRGSVLNNDIKQKLVKERREENRRQKDATKELQLLEKDIKSKIHYMKQMEEKKKKLREQKQKDEQRRIAAEEKRNQKFQQERAKFNAAVARTLERCTLIECQKSWSWKGSPFMNSESKTVNKQSKSTEKLNQTFGSKKQTTLSSSSLQKSIAKSIHRPERGCMNIPLFNHSSDESKNTIELCKPTVAMPSQEKVKTPLKVTRATPPEGSATEAVPKASVEEAPRANVELALTSVEAPFKVTEEAASIVSVEAMPKTIMGSLPNVSMEALTENEESSPEGSEDLSLASVDPSPEVSMDSSSSEVSLDSYPEVSAASMATIPEESLETIFEENIEMPSKVHVEGHPKLCPEGNVETSEVKVKDISQKSDPVIRRHISIPMPFPRWPSSISGWCSPSSFDAKQIQKNHLFMSKPSSQSTLFGKLTPVQHTVFAQNVLGTSKRKKEAVSKTTNISEAMSQKHMMYEESGYKSTQGIMKAEETIKILTAKQCLIHEQREKGKQLKEMKQRKEKGMTKTAVEKQFSKFDNGQQQMEIKKKKGCQDQEYQKVLLQKGDASIKAWEEADGQKKEQKKIMLQNLPERLERGKVAQISSSDKNKEHGVDDKNESETEDTDCLEDFHPSAFMYGMNASTKRKTKIRNVKSTPRLLFLDDNSDKVHLKTEASCKRNVKNFRQNMKDPLTQTKDIGLSTIRMANQAIKSGTSFDISSTNIPSKSYYSVFQGCVCDQMPDMTNDIDVLITSAHSEHQRHCLKFPTTFHQSLQTPLDDKDRNDSDSTSSDA